MIGESVNNWLFLVPLELPHQPIMVSVRLNDVSETSVDLRWSPPGFNGNSDIRKFSIYSKMLNPGQDILRHLTVVIIISLLVIIIVIIIKYYYYNYYYNYYLKLLTVFLFLALLCAYLSPSAKTIFEC